MPGARSRSTFAARTPSSVPVGGMRMSVTHDVGLLGVDRGEQLVEVAARADDLDVVLRLEQAGEPFAHEIVVFGDDHPDRHTGLQGTRPLASLATSASRAVTAVVSTEVANLIVRFTGPRMWRDSARTVVGCEDRRAHGHRPRAVRRDAAVRHGRRRRAGRPGRSGRRRRDGPSASSRWTAAGGRSASTSSTPTASRRCCGWSSRPTR